LLTGAVDRGPFAPLHSAEVDLPEEPFDDAASFMTGSGASSSRSDVGSIFSRETVDTTGARVRIQTRLVVDPTSARHTSRSAGGMRSSSKSSLGRSTASLGLSQASIQEEDLAEEKPKQAKTLLQRMSKKSAAKSEAFPPAPQRTGPSTSRGGGPAPSKAGKKADSSIK
jgi:hypothetical protein